MLINRRDAMLGGKRLPYDAEVEYLEIDNSENVIFTPLRFCDLPGAKLTVAISLSTSVARNSGQFLGVIASTSGGYFRYGGYQSITIGIGINNLGTIAQDTSYNETIRTLVIDFPANKILIDNSETSIKPKDAWDNNVREAVKTYTSLICLGAVGSSSYGRVGTQFHAVSCVLRGDLLFDLLPVRRTLDGVSVGEMYDRVTGTFMERHGTFVTGPDK